MTDNRESRPIVDICSDVFGLFNVKQSLQAAGIVVSCFYQFRTTNTNHQLLHVLYVVLQTVSLLLCTRSRVHVKLFYRII